MEKKLFIAHTIEINATTGNVWDALINPNKTKQYMYNCEPITNWEIGSTLDWKGEYEGKEMVFVTGIVKKFDPLRKLVYTTFDPNSNTENKIENHLTVTYEIKKDNGKVYLSISQGDYAKVEDGQKRYDEAQNDGHGWIDILHKIKEISEK